MSIDKVNIAAVFAKINEYWVPKIGGDINEAQLKFVKFSGSFNWHHHDREDELFLVVKGTLRMRLQGVDGGDIVVNKGEYVIVPKGVEHCPEAVSSEVHCLLFESGSTLNTGNVVNDRTRTSLDRI
jgi:mannose-6-phosphate isomerase-like protein (cupin superfamily)